MSRRQLPRAAAATLDAATFLPGEIAVDTTNDELRYDGDGSTVGGIAVARKDGTNLNASASSVTAAGSTTARTLAARFAEVFNILDYGATAASTNNYAAVNLAIAACNAAGGGTIYVPEGNFDIDLPSGTGLTSFGAGTRVKGAGRYVSTITINCTTTTFLNAFGNVGDIIFEDIRIVFNPQAGQTAALLVLASNTEFYRCDVVSNNSVVADDDTNDGIWLSVPESGSYDWLVLSDCTWSNWHYPVLRTNTSTAVLTNTFLHNCQAYDNGVCHFEFNAPNGSWSNIYVTNFQMGDQSGVGAGVGFGIAFASCTNVHINGMGFVGTTDGEAVHIEEAHGGFTLTDFYIDVTSDESGEGDGIVLLNNNVGGSQSSPTKFSITNGIIKRSGSTGGRGLWLLDTTGTTPLTDGLLDNITISGFTANENLLLQTSMASVVVGHINCADTADIAAAATVDLGKAKSDYVNVTGSGQSITSFGSAPVGVRRVARFNGANTLTHNGTSLILPGGANITTAADDVSEMVSLGSGNWLCMNHKLGTGGALPALFASAAEVRALASTTKAITPAALAGRAMFSVTLSANQTGISSATSTKVNFNTEANDVGGYYDNATNYRWTPPAGPVRLSGSAHISGATTGGNAQLHIRKNGSDFKSTIYLVDASGEAFPNLTCNDVANGTDYYELFVRATSGGTNTVNANTWSYFQGEQI